MPLVNFLQRIGGAVSGAVAKLLKFRPILVFHPDDFDVADQPTSTIQGTTSDPGTGTGYTLVSGRGKVATSRTLTGSGTVKVDGSNSPQDLSANRTISLSGNLTGIDNVTLTDGARTIGVAQKSSTGANSGAVLILKGQKGQQQSGGGANNDGGAVDVEGGDPGTGGGGAAGLYGSAGIKSSLLRLGVVSAGALSGVIFYRPDNGDTYFFCDIGNNIFSLEDTVYIFRIPEADASVGGTDASTGLRIWWDGTNLKATKPDGTVKTFTWT